MLKIGLTGGLGSGKSTIAKIFEVLGIPVYYADTEAKRIMNDDPQLKAEIRKHFGDEAYIENQLNRPYLSSIVFNNRDKLALLNSIVHPATIRDSKEWINKQITPYAIKEAALIFESGSQESLDYVIGVSAPAHLRIERAMQRDQLSREQVQQRMSKQIEEVIKMHLCDFVIYNDEVKPVIPQVLELHKKLSALSKK
ncbi:MAG: dephospho-CoA kinase [Chitinophagaceae bacterium]|nr:dephospho-CoA kinase [Chitinophagaceae bacterium]